MARGSLDYPLPIGFHGDFSPARNRREEGAGKRFAQDGTGKTIVSGNIARSGPPESGEEVQRATA